MIDAQTERLARMQQSNDTILNRQVAELQASELAAQKARHAKTRADLVATHISRQQQLKWKADARKQEQLETEHFASQLGALNERLRSEEHAKVAHDRAERARLDDFHFGQMAHKQALELAEIEDEAHETAHVQQYLEVRAAPRARAAASRGPWRPARSAGQRLACAHRSRAARRAPTPFCRRRTRRPSSSSTPRCARPRCRRRARARARSRCSSPRRRSSPTER